jgi:hypothetical protein
MTDDDLPNAPGDDCCRGTQPLADIREIQRFVASIPDRDPRLPDEILGYDESGLPA